MSQPFYAGAGNDRTVDTYIKNLRKKLRLDCIVTVKGYDAYIIPSGTEEYHYTKDGEEKSGVQFKIVMEFPKKKFSGGKRNEECLMKMR